MAFPRARVVVFGVSWGVLYCRPLAGIACNRVGGMIGGCGRHLFLCRSWRYLTLSLVHFKEAAVWLLSEWQPYTRAVDGTAERGAYFLFLSFGGGDGEEGYMRVPLQNNSARSSSKQSFRVSAFHSEQASFGKRVNIKRISARTTAAAKQPATQLRQ